MSDFDWANFVNLLIVPSLSAIAGGVVGAIVTHYFEMRRLRKEWAKDKEELQSQWAHDRDLLHDRLQYADTLLQKVQEHEKRMREWLTDRNDISKRSYALIEAIQWFRHWVPDDIMFAADMTILQAYSELQTRLYTWDEAVRPHLEEDQQDALDCIESRLAAVHTPIDLSRGPGDSDVSRISKAVSQLTQSALAAVQAASAEKS